jgi:hypothetical protein
MAVEPGPRHRENWDLWKTTIYPGYKYDGNNNIIADKTISENTGRYQIFDDVVVENFHSRSEAGELFNNPATNERVEVFKTPIKRLTTYINDWGGLNAYVSSTPGTDFAPPFLGAVDTDYINEQKEIAGTKAWAKVSSDELNLLVTAGELRETARMFHEALNALWTVGRVILRKRALWTVKPPDPWDFWLSVRYGWRPFVAECRAIHEHFSQVAKELAERQTFRSGRNLYNVVTDDITVEQPSNDGTHAAVWRRESQITGFVSAGVLAIQRVTGFPDTYGLTKIPNAVWDLTRLSFAVGWFLNVADILAAWTPDTLWNPQLSWTSQVYVHSQRNVLLDWECTDSNHSSCTGSGGLAHRISDIYIREPAAERGIIPSIRVNFDAYKLLDAIALFKQFWQNVRR